MTKTVADRYTLLEELGRGGMGVVYKAYDRFNKQTVALKQVHVAISKLDFASRPSTDSDLAVMLADEFRTVASLRHPNIISVLDYGFNELRQPYFTMEYLENAQGLLEAGADKSQDEQIKLVIQLLQAIAYLHRRHIIHRDLKPDNVVVVAGQLKTLDFGLAILGHDTVSLDKMAGIAGTLPYMAPEILTGMVPHPGSDLWSVGIMFYELLTGIHPFEAHDSSKLLSNLLEHELDIVNLDIPLKLADVLKRLLAKDPLERYDNAFTVIDDLYQVLGREQGSETQDYRESFIQAAKFVGREGELLRLQAMLSKIKNGHGNGVLIGGESGVGKSRLLDEIRTYALVEGISVFRGQTVANGGLPFQLWRDVVRHLVLSVELEELQKQILKEIVPDIGELLGETVEDAPKINSTAETDRLKFTIVDLLKRYAKPGLLILEDLQWAGESLTVLKNLVFFLPDLPLMIIGSYRSDETPNLPEEVPELEQMQLARLDDKAIAELSGSILGELGQEAHILDVLKRETEGNCFFLVEVIRSLAEEAGRLANIGRMTLPAKIFAGGIQQLVQRRLSRLPQRVQNWLQLVAVAGRQLDKKLIAYLSVQLGYPEWEDEFLLLCSEAAVLEVDHEIWRFSHDKLRETLIADILDEERPALHRQIATAIEAIYPDDSAHNESLLEHWHGAAELDKALSYLEKVALNLIRIRAEYDHALSLLNRGLDALPIDDLRRITPLNLQSLAYILQGNYDDGTSSAQAAFELAQRANKLEGLARSISLLGSCNLKRGHYDRSIEQLQESIKLYRSIDDIPGVADSLVSLGLTYSYQGHNAQASDYLLQSLEMSQRIGDVRLSAASFLNLGFIAIQTENYEQAKQYTEQSLAIVRQTGDPLGMAYCLNNLGYIIMKQGNYEQARTYVEESLAIARRIGSPYTIVYASLSLGDIALKQHNLSSARLHFYEGLSLAQILNARPVLITAISLIALYLHLDTNTLRAAELRALLMVDSAIDNDTKHFLETDLPESMLLEALGEQELQAATIRGKSLNFDTVVQELLNEL